MYLYSIFFTQAAVYCIHRSTDGYATGSRDGSIKLWDNNFQPITVIDLTKTPAGYPGITTLLHFNICGYLSA